MQVACSALVLCAGTVCDVGEWERRASSLRLLPRPCCPWCGVMAITQRSVTQRAVDLHGPCPTTEYEHMIGNLRGEVSSLKQRLSVVGGVGGLDALARRRVTMIRGTSLRASDLQVRCRRTGVGVSAVLHFCLLCGVLLRE